MTETVASGSRLESSFEPFDNVASGYDREALMGIDGQQVLAVPGDDQLGARRDGA